MHQEAYEMYIILQIANVLLSIYVYKAVIGLVDLRSIELQEGTRWVIRIITFIISYLLYWIATFAPWWSLLISAFLHTAFWLIMRADYDFE